MIQDKIDVSVYKYQNYVGYSNVPFQPKINYIEFTNQEHIIAEGDNEAYEGIRQILYDLGLDKENFGTKFWNPLKALIPKNGKVVIKPNLVYHEHPKGDQNVLSMVTNAAILRPIIDYILLARGKDVEIIIGDAPVQGADFKKVTKLSKIDELCEFYKNIGIQIKVLDFREIISERNEEGILDKRYYNPNRTPESYTFVDLREQSELIDIIENKDRLTITDYKNGSVSKHHNQTKNEYMIPNEILNCDLFINVPKLKTHRKAGLTCAMKNLVGINGDKTCIAHHTKGLKKGDEFSGVSYRTYARTRIWGLLKSNKIGIKLAGVIKKIFQRYVWGGQTLNEHSMSSKPNVLAEGSWHGNNTIWRCVKDINKILLYVNKDGVMQNSKQRNYLCIVDAVLAGECEGPMEQSTKEIGVVFGSLNPVYTDYIASKLMKFNYKDIPTIHNSFSNRWWDLVDKEAEDIIVNSNIDMGYICSYFQPSFGWQDKLKEFEG